MLRLRLVKITGKSQRKLLSSSSARLLNNVLQGRAGTTRRSTRPPRKRNQHIPLWGFHGDSWLWGFEKHQKKSLSSHVTPAGGCGSHCRDCVCCGGGLTALSCPNFRIIGLIRQKNQAKTPSRIVFRNPLNPVKRLRLQQVATS